MNPELLRQCIRAQDAQRVRWRNGAGWTREIHVESGLASREDWRWRLSIAELDQPAAFSTFEGIERELLLLTGDGLDLQFDDGEHATLLPPYARKRFAGDRGLQGCPAGAGVTVLNLMWRPDALAASVWHRPLVGTMVVFVEPDACWLVHVLAGQVRLGTDMESPLERGDTVLLRTVAGRGRQVLDGGGELLLARLAPLDTPTDEPSCAVAQDGAALRIGR